MYVFFSAAKSMKIDYTEQEITNTMPSPLEMKHQRPMKSHLLILHWGVLNCTSYKLNESESVSRSGTSNSLLPNGL